MCILIKTRVKRHRVLKPKKAAMQPKYMVILTKSETGGFVVECPSLPGCFSEGETREEALSNIREAIELSLETRKADGLSTQALSVEIAEVQLAVNG
jgi:predicted RNase H-like HicB family nuclease